MEELTPRRIVAELDRHIVGQVRAKRAVAVALRNRWRRQQLQDAERAEIHPKNLILIGPTGVGKTEIARRLASLVRAPFLKVEVTKYSEVGYVGRDVESIVRDLLDVAVEQVRSEMGETLRAEAAAAAEERLVEALARARAERTPLVLDPSPVPFAQPRFEEPIHEVDRGEIRARLRSGELEREPVEVRVEDRSAPALEIFTGSGTEVMGFDPASFSHFFNRSSGPRTRTARLAVADARRVLEREEAEKRIDREAAVREAIRRTEEAGIVFLDEIDKIAGRSHDGGPDVSREGVQRDLLPLVEGTTVPTRHGPVQTDYVLFVAAGAFHIARPTDLIPELQGRFPVRVNLDPLGRDDFVRILTEPENALTKQYRALLGVERVDLAFPDDGVREIATLADRLNVALGDIGARRLHTVLERLLERTLYAAPEESPPRVVVDAPFVREEGKELYEEADLSRL